MLKISMLETGKIGISLSNLFAWSNLRKIGGMPIMKATVISPFIAYAIVFNDYFVKFIQATYTSLGDEIVFGYNLSNLYYIYYGLLILGISSIIYAIFCPNNISRHPDSLSFSKEISETGAKAQVLSMLDDVLQSYVNYAHKTETHETSKMPYSTKKFIDRILVEIYRTYDQKEMTERQNEVETGEDERVFADNLDGDSFHSKFYTGSGYLIPEAIAECIYSSRRHEQAFTESLKCIGANDFSADIAKAKYLIDDLTYIYIRGAVFILYMSGIILIIIPSAKSFLRISLSILMPRMYN